METLRERLAKSSRFLFGVELVSVRGSMAEKSAIKARAFADQLTSAPFVDWISITDNAGGNPQMAPQAFAKPILYAGKEVVIHLTCKDLNRNGLESLAWQLSSEGFRNVLAMTGDHPVSGNGGMAKPVFDLDSVGLISLLAKMNRGFDQLHEKTDFHIGAVVNNYKVFEGEVIPQLAKLLKKVAAGASFIINQVGYDSRKAHELRVFVEQRIPVPVPLIGNVFLLNAKRARTFNSGKIPGVVVTAELMDLCSSQSRSPDEGKAFFLELAAKQVAVFRGLGYRGAYIGGVHDVHTVEKIIEIEKTFSSDDWKRFAREIRFGRPGEYYLFKEDPSSGLADASLPNSTSRLKSGRAGIIYGVSKLTHDHMFTPGRPLSYLGAWICQRSKDPYQGPALVRAAERLSKSIMYDCRDCGDCSLPETAFLCPESQCAKNQRNGPCGGTCDGHCEADGQRDCIWLRAYERLKHDGKESTLLDHAPVFQDQALRSTSSWANNWLGRDHATRTSKLTNEQ